MYRSPITGDTAGVGISALALSVDPFLHNLCYPITDPYILDLSIGIPLQLISGFNPLVLKLTGYLFFLFLIIVLSYLVYWATNDKLKSVVLPVLVVCLGAHTQIFLMLPLFHFLTISISLLYLAYFYDLNRPFKSIFLPLLFSFVVAYSDLVFLAFFLIPYTVWIVYTWKTRNNNAKPIMVLAGFYFLAALSYVVKLVIGGYSLKSNVLNPISTYPDNIQNILGNLLGNLIMLYSARPNIISGILFVVWALAVIYLLSRLDYKIFKNGKPNYIVVSMLVVCFCVVAGFLVFETLTYGRFIIFITISLLVLACIAFPKIDLKIRGALILILSVSLIFNIGYMINVEDINKHHYELINVLKENNLSYGFADFEDAGPITYLSSGKIIVVNCNNKPDTVERLPWLTENKWYRANASGFILQYKNDSQPFFELYRPTNTISVGEYQIQVYDNLPI